MGDGMMKSTMRDRGQQIDELACAQPVACSKAKRSLAHE